MKTALYFSHTHYHIEFGRFLMFRILIGLAAVWAFAGGFAPAANMACANNSEPQRECKPCKRPDGTLNNAPNVTDLVLDKTEIRLADMPLAESSGDVSAAMLINVATNAHDAENDVLDYYYVVSAGRIVGSGSNVQWDLSGVGPGTYTITAKVDDSCGVCGSTKTKLIKVIGRIVPTLAPIVSSAPAAIAPPRATVSTRTNVLAPPTSPARVPSSIAATRAPVPTRAAVPPTKSVSITKAAAPAPPSTYARITPRPSAVVKGPASAMNALASSPPPGKPCSCPLISIADPERAGSDLIFTTNIDGMFSNQLSFIWTVIGGNVVSQDKRTIRINPGNVAVGGSVNVIVNGLEPRCSCPNRAQKTF